jgi:hypothetical protein
MVSEEGIVMGNGLFYRYTNEDEKLNALFTPLWRNFIS